MNPRCLVLLLCLLPCTAPAAGLTLLVQLDLASPAERQAVAALAHEIGATLGEPVEPRWSANVLAHWRRMARTAAPALVLEPVHFAAWRQLHHGYLPLAQSSVSRAWTLVSRRGATLFEPDDLVGLPVAGPVAPSLAALQLQALFADPLRRPRTVGVGSSDEALALLVAGDVAAALLPGQVAGGRDDLRAMLSLEEVPALMLMVVPALGPGLLARLRDALPLPGGVLGDFAAPEQDPSRHGALLRGTWGAQFE